MSGKYEIGERIGGGGMAEVFRARALGEAGFARPVAIKRVLPSISRNPEFCEMFINEARIASMLTHPNIVSVMNFARDSEDQLFLVMELVEGTDLFQLMCTGPVPLPVGTFIIAEVLRALSYAHKRRLGGKPLGIVHRDISPQNILLSWDGAVKVSDFGIAKAVAISQSTGTVSLKGKLGYLSPEQIRSISPLDGRVDLFAAGVILHELLTGQPLYSGSTDAEILAQMIRHEIPSPRSINPDVPEALDRVVMKLLEADRDQRYSEAEAALGELVTAGPIARLGEVELSNVLLDRFPQRNPSGAFQALGMDLPQGAKANLIEGDFSKRSHEESLPPEDAPTAAHHAGAPATAAPSTRPVKGAASSEARAFTEHATTTSPGARDITPLMQEAKPRMDRTLIAAVMVALIAAGTALFFAFSGRKTPAAAPPPAHQIYVARVMITPTRAVLELDGTAIGTGPYFERSFVKDGHEHVLRVSAEGFEPATIKFKDASPSDKVALAPVKKGEEPAAKAEEAAPTAETPPPPPAAAEAKGKGPSAKAAAENKGRSPEHKPAWGTKSTKPKTSVPILPP